MGNSREDDSVVAPLNNHDERVATLESNAIQRCTEHDLAGTLRWMLPAAVEAMAARAGAFYLEGSLHQQAAFAQSGLPEKLNPVLAEALRGVSATLTAATPRELAVESLGEWSAALREALSETSVQRVLFLPILQTAVVLRNRHKTVLAFFHDQPPGSLTTVANRIAKVFIASTTVHVALDVAQSTAAEVDAMLAATVDAVVVIDQSGGIEVVNPAAERIFGWTAKEMIGRNVRLLMPEPFRSDHDSYLDNYLSTGHARIIGIGREATAVRKNGTEFPIDLAVGEIPSVGRRRRFLGMVRDISARKQTEHQLQEARERLAHVARISTMGEMATGIAHEVNQPLTAIATYADACRRLLRDGRAGDPDFAEGLEQIGEEARRAGQIIHRLRALVSRRPGERNSCKINDVINDVIRLAEVDTRLHNISLRVDLLDPLPPVRIDSVQIQQVVLNLIRNATDAMELTEPARRVISVHTSLTPKGEIQVEVADNGHGISGGKSEMYEPFFTTKPTGMGLGLSISRSIVTSHGGRLWHSPNSGGGTTFHFTLAAALGENHEE